MILAAPKLPKAPVFLKTLRLFGTYIILMITYGLAIKPALLWIFNELSIETIIYSLIAACLGTTVLIWRMGLPRNPLAFPALCLLLISALASIWTFPILQQLSASFALFGVYGFFAGLNRVSSLLWRKGLIMAGLAALALPFALVPGTGMGFYLRLITADAAAQLLAIIGHTSLSAHDVLVFDNGIAQVDLPCSGLKSLFTGTGFFFIASLILRRAINLKWMIGYSIFIGLLIVANTLRVTVLIWVSEVLEQRGIAETIHMPLGLMLFCLVSLCGILILYKLRPYNSEQKEENTNTRSNNFRYGFCLFISAVLMTSFLLAPQKNTIADVSLTPPASLQLTSIALTSTEANFFGARDRTFAGKWLFNYKSLSGSMLVVRSGAANGLHAPEICLLGNGISVDHMESRAFKMGNYRWLTVDHGKRNAVYWMQSERLVTDDFRKRLSNYVFRGQDDWIMVTLLFNDSLNLSEKSEDTVALQTLMSKLQTYYAKEIIRE